MPFGRRVFSGLVVVDGSHVARFLPIIMDAAIELVSEQELRLALRTNDTTAAPLDDCQEVAAFRVFDKLYGSRTMRRPNREPVKVKKGAVR